jgi:predicted TIM-barrel fold metal-dependent hydrolase
MMTQVLQPAPAQTPPVAAGRRRTIVDAQVHLWKAETPDLPWVPGIKPQLPEPFTIERVLPLMDEAGVDRIIVVPPTLTGERNDYGLEAARRYPNRFAVMGRFPIDNPKAADRLARWKEQPGMLGVRISFGGTKWLSDGTVDWFWPAAEKAGVPVMFLAPGELSHFAGIAERHPQLTLIIDHIGMNNGIPIAQSATDAIALAKYPNVSVKMKAGAQYAPEPYPYRAMNVQLKRVFEAFGPQRCYWETDITQTLKEGGYKHRVAHFTEELPFLSEEDKDWVMGRAILARLKWA